MRMNAIEKLEKQIGERFPNATLAIDRPAHARGRWFLDVSLRDHAVVVEWRPDKGFGISTPSGDSYGEGPDEVFPDADAAWRRVRALLLGRTKTRPPDEVRLRSLRSLLDVSQVTLAERLNVNQAAISKLEHREDMLVSTLGNVIRALGGALEIRAVFPHGIVRMLTLADDAGTSGAGNASRAVSRKTPTSRATKA